MGALSEMPSSLSSEQKLERFLTQLAVERKVSASTQNQAFNAILFFYKAVLGQPLEHVDALRATRPAHGGIVAEARPPVHFFGFDLLRHNGTVLLNHSLEEQQALLEQMARDWPEEVPLCPVLPGRSTTLCCPSRSNLNHCIKFGDFIRSKRVGNGITARQASQPAGKLPFNFSKLEHGALTPPKDPLKLHAIAQANHDANKPFSPPIHDLHLVTFKFHGLVFGGYCGSWKYKPKGNACMND